MEELVFETKEDVIEFLLNIPELEPSPIRTFFSKKGTYTLNYGEHSRPLYRPRKYKDGWGIHVQYHYYVTVANAPQSGRVDKETFINRFCLEE